MSLVDPISDMLTRIRNAYAVQKDEVCLSISKAKVAILVVLKETGYISNYEEKDGQLCITLKYNGSEPAIKKIERVSKPGRRIYVKKDEIPSVLSGQGIAVLSTSKGIMTGSQAKAGSLGGELICKVY